MLKFYHFVSVLVLFLVFDIVSAIANKDNESVNELRYCLAKAAHPNLRECVGRTAISFLQRFDETDNFTFGGNIIATRDDAVASRSLVNFLDTDPVDFRGILENAGAVISQRALEFHMDTIYPGLMFKIGPSADSHSVAQFILDPTVAERNLNYEEPSTARILTKNYILPFLLGLKFNLVALVPILFTILCLLLKKSLFIAKLVIYISSILGVGGVAGVLGSFASWKQFIGGHGFGAGIPPPLAAQNHVFGGSVGVYPGKNTVYSQYDQDELQHVSPYKRQDRKVVFEKKKEDAGLNNNNNNGNIKDNLHSTVDPFFSNPATDRFYEYEKQFLMQDRSGKLRTVNSNIASSAYSDSNDEEISDVLSTSANYHFKTSDNSGWQVVHPRI